MPRLAPDDPRLTAPDFPHATNLGYSRGCSCDACRAAHAQHRWEQRRGVPRPASVLHSVSTAEARRHVEQLLGHVGVRRSAIARAAGVSQQAVLNIMRKPTVYSATVEAVLAVTLNDVASNQRLVDARPAMLHIHYLLQGEDSSYAAIAAAAGLTLDAVELIAESKRVTISRTTDEALRRLNHRVVRRNAATVSSHRTITRLRALQANRWTIAALTELTGLAVPNILRDNRPYVTQETERIVEKLYDVIGDRPGNSVSSAELAKQLGYHEPIHYDENMNLIPGSVPDHRWSPSSSPEDRARDKLRMLGLTLRELPSQEIANRLNVSKKTVDRARSEIGIRLDPNALDSVLLPFIRPGQDAIVELILRHTSGIELSENISVLDDDGLDYVTLWDSLRSSARRLCAAPVRDLAVA